MRMDNQYLPENATLELNRITRVNVRAGQAWRFYYDDGTSFLTDSLTDKVALMALFEDWDIETEFGGDLEVYTRPQ